MKENDRSILAWCLYDVGNSAFATTIMAVIYPIYFQQVAASTLSPSSATAYWGYASSLGLLIGAFLAPFLGTFADIRSIRKKFVAIFTALGAISALAMGSVESGDWKTALLFLVLGSVGFSGSAICYDSLLPHIAPVERMDEISTKGYAMGYLGGGTLLALNLGTMSLFPGALGARLSFMSVGLWWIAFAVPLMIVVPEPQRAFPDGLKKMGTFASLAKTFREIREYRDAFVFLLAFWLYNDGIGTVIRMSAIFGAQVGLDRKSMVMALLATQFIGIPFSLLFGKIAKKIGSKKSLYGALSWYLLIAIGAYWMRTSLHFWMLAISVGMVQGGAQAISRSIYASMLPPERSAEFFGFYDISSKFAGIAGPAAFGIITQLTGSPRLAVLAIGSTFIIGLFLLSFVDVDRGRQKGIMRRSY
ncbi:major facilitator superfamily MFS_1 [Dethiosulfovibrio peptidovorans DSM 11002]|uniref:Major facilitator superfamily MFS_1 n=1 Tax=Dethiosulfovibrio peptidovorans DSM 11002 TaxID=469381 RepID=D2Z8B3_9BACT|nr:MFS transporter [Dethiosulfovibrio peptidovorans]EFC91710.1 major facilitator superfamily MFS_1 [Dethiosulfovibrio peptidovorans DSM 11002]